jgi:RHS repeat-associated protein
VNNIYLNGVRVAASLPNGECQYYLTDQVDSVSVVTDDKAEVVNRFEYLPYGESWITEGDGRNRAKYNSQELDAETNFYFYNARYYDPEVSRFVTADNVIDGEYSTQGWNRYSYCHNNPVRYKDPTGHGYADGEMYRDTPVGTATADGSNKMSKDELYSNAARNNIKSGAAKLNQGEGAGAEQQLKKAKSSYDVAVDPNSARQSACVALGLYNMLKANNANVEGSFAEFYGKQTKTVAWKEKSGENVMLIRSSDAYVNDPKKIVEQYTIEGKPITLKTSENFKSFEKDKSTVGMVRYYTGEDYKDGREIRHTMNFYNGTDGEKRMADVGRSRNSGNPVSQVVNEANFRSYSVIAEKENKP